MTTSLSSIDNAGHIIDSVSSHIADLMAAQGKPKQQQTNTFTFGGVEYTAPPKPRNTLIPTPRIG
ncbi:hypothetical protein SAMN04490181_1288 [Pseudomonas brenneri]|jgi:hypothetical protein|uniref:Uncharacterized protein n=1 Tax=Pseudomonas brenneri TaxID=129817 RepID=A0ABY0W9N7_9PSED|nr:hypothetical protein SAMN04490181_1288 [Pseudomonas brenneri]